MRYQSELTLRSSLKEQQDTERTKYPLFYGEVLLNDKQEEFLYCGQLENGIIIPPRTRVYSSGNQSGKSACGYLEDAAWCLGYRPWLDSNHPNYYTAFRPPIKLLICTESLSSTAKDAFWSDWLNLIPERYYDTDNIETSGPQKAVIGIPFKNGSFIRIMSYDQKTKNFESTKYQCIHYDETPPEDKYIASQRALIKADGFTWFTFTNIYQPWLKRDITNKHDGKKVFVVKGTIWNNEIRYVEDNGKTKQKGGLTHESIINYLGKIKDPKMRKARETGEADHFAGPVYDIFDNTHIIEKPEEHPIFRSTGGKIPMHWTRGMVVDPHENRPFAMSWYAISPKSPDGRVNVFIHDEYPSELFHEMGSDDKNIKQLAELIRAKEGKDNIFIRHIDKRYFNKPSMSTKMTLADEFAQNDIFFYPSEEGDPNTSIQLVKDWLFYDRTKSVDSLNSPRVYIFRKCQNMIYSLENYYWGDVGGGDNDGFATKPSKKNKCFSDLLGFIIAAGPENYATKPEAGQRQPYHPEKEYKLRVMNRQRRSFKTRSMMYAK